MSSHRPGTPPAGQSQKIDISTISRFFRGVSYSNYFLLLGCGNALLWILINIWSMHSAEDFIEMGIIGAVCGFATWVGWRNIGVLNAMVNAYTTTALMLLCIFSSLLSIYLLPRSFASSDGSHRAAVSAAVYIFVAPVSLAGLLSLFVLRRLSLPGLQAKLRLFLMSGAPAPHHQGVYLRPLNPIKGYGALALGLIWLVGMNAIPDDKLPKEVVQQEYRLSNIAFVFLIYARHYLRPDFQTFVSSDQRAPVLFLRSFEDDEQVDYQRADRALFDFSLESRLADQYNSLGPFIAIGKPGDKMPHLGAARASLSDAEWQDRVTNWMKDSTLIILMIGRTHWVEWELRRVVESGYTWKLMILFPQVRRPRWKLFWRAERRQDAEDRLMVIRRVFEGTPWQSGLRLTDDIKPTHLRSLAFLPGGDVTVVTSMPRNRESYHLAALIARQAQLRWKRSWNAAVVPNNQRL